MVKRSPGSLLWIFGFRVEGANLLFIEPTVIWEMLLLCELLLLVGFVYMNNFFSKMLSPLIFLSECLPPEPILSLVIFIIEEKFLWKFPPKFKLGSLDSASKLLTITP